MILRFNYSEKRNWGEKERSAEREASWGCLVEQGSGGRQEPGLALSVSWQFCLGESIKERYQGEIGKEFGATPVQNSGEGKREQINLSVLIDEKQWREAAIC